MAGRSSTHPAPEYLVLGEILRPHGVRGELRMRVLTDYPERIAHLERVYLGTAPEDRRINAYIVQHMRMHQGYGLLKLETINDRSQADLLRGLLVMVGIQDAIPLEEGEVYLYQLIGLAVMTEAGEEIGVLADVLETGANDVYLVNSPAYGEVLIPVMPETILKTDEEEGVIVVRLPEGLLPD
jgi:16S rRNA processing protein RimM